MFFSDVIDELQKVHLEAGHVMLGPLLLFAILFADDLVLLARSVKDLRYGAQQAQWWFFLGFKACPSKEYLVGSILSHGRCREPYKF